MKIDTFHFRVEVSLEITRAEHRHLMELAKHHYDFKCKGIASPGLGGFLYGWESCFTDPELVDKITVTATWNNIDTLCKVTEAIDANPDLAWALRMVMKDMRAEYERVNAHLVEK